MSDEKLREWVEEKLDEGLDEERLRKSLENTGHDPSIVDEVKSPFEGEGVEEDPFQEDSGRYESGDESRKPESGEDQEQKGEDPELSLPVIPFPDISLGKRHAAVAFIVLALLGAGYFVQSSEVLEPEKQCAGVKMYSVSGQGGSTVAEVRVVEEALVVLEVFENGKKVGEARKKMSGRGTIRVDAVGDRASFHGIKCPEQSSDRKY